MTKEGLKFYDFKVIGKSPRERCYKMKFNKKSLIIDVLILIIPVLYCLA